MLGCKGIRFHARSFGTGTSKIVLPGPTGRVSIRVVTSGVTLKRSIDEQSKRQSCYAGTGASGLRQNQDDGPNSEPDCGTEEVVSALSADGLAAERARRHRLAVGVHVRVSDSGFPRTFAA